MKRIFSIFSIAVISLTLLLTGCGGDKVIKIGVILPLTGPIATIGKNIKCAVETAIDDVNADGGIKGRKVELFFEDSVGMPEKGVEAFMKLVKQDKVSAIIGPVASEVTLKIAPLAEKYNVPVVSPTSSSPEITRKGNDWVFRVYPSDTIEARRLADTIFTKLYIRKFIPIAIKNSYGYGISNEVIKIARNTESMNVMKVIRYSPDATYERFVEIAKEVKELGPEAVLFASYPPDFEMLLKAFNEEGVKCYKFATSSIALPEILKNLGDLAVGLIYAKAPFNAKSTKENVKKFVEEYTSKCAHTPDVYAAHGYDAAIITAKAHSKSSRPDDILRRLQQVKGYEGVSGEISFDKFGDVIKFPKIFKVRKNEEDGSIMCTIFNEEDMKQIKEEILKVE